MISCEIKAHSINPIGVPIVSFVWTYPRFIHSEVMTHRAGSKNAASSRAIPIAKMLEMVQGATAWPEYFGAHQKGMQAGEELGDKDVLLSDLSHLRDECVSTVSNLNQKGLHKQIANRYIEPFSHITVLITFTARGIENLFALRAHKDAQPEFQVLAYRTLYKYLNSMPKQLNWGEWHIPKFANVEEKFNSEDEMLKISTARCARLSYLTFDGEHSREKDLDLYDKLITTPPVHASPLEHIAQAKRNNKISNFDMGYLEDHNYYSVPLVADLPFQIPKVVGTCGWEQYRKQVPNEMSFNIDLKEILANKPDWITL